MKITYLNEGVFTNHKDNNRTLSSHEIAARTGQEARKRLITKQVKEACDTYFKQKYDDGKPLEIGHSFIPINNSNVEGQFDFAVELKPVDDTCYVIFPAILLNSDSDDQILFINFENCNKWNGYVEWYLNRNLRDTIKEAGLGVRFKICLDITRIHPVSNSNVVNEVRFLHVGGLDSYNEYFFNFIFTCPFIKTNKVLFFCSTVNDDIIDKLSSYLVTNSVTISSDNYFDKLDLGNLNKIINPNSPDEYTINLIKGSHYKDKMIPDEQSVKYLGKTWDELKKEYTPSDTWYRYCMGIRGYEINSRDFSKYKVLYDEK